MLVDHTHDEACWLCVFWVSRAMIVWMYCISLCPLLVRPVRPCVDFYFIVIFI